MLVILRVMRIAIYLTCSSLYSVVNCIYLGLDSVIFTFSLLGAVHKWRMQNVQVFVPWASTSVCIFTQSPLLSALSKSAFGVSFPHSCADIICKCPLIFRSHGEIKSFPFPFQNSSESSSYNADTSFAWNNVILPHVYDRAEISVGNVIGGGIHHRVRILLISCADFWALGFHGSTPFGIDSKVSTNHWPKTAQLDLLKPRDRPCNGQADNRQNRWDRDITLYYCKYITALIYRPINRNCR